MKVLFLDAPYKGKVELTKNTINYLKKNKIKTVGLYASVQFCNNLDKVKEQLNELGIQIISSLPKRANAQHQILGCDNYHDSLNLNKEKLEEIQAYLYIGDGRFHPYALAYAQKDAEKIKEIVCDDPIGGKLSIINENNVKTILKRHKASLIKFLSSNSVGIIITIKPGQEQFRPSLVLEKRYPDKKFYYFIDNNVSFDQLENFPFIDVWINTACPRIGLDDQEKFLKGVINLNDAVSAEEIVSNRQFN